MGRDVGTIALAAGLAAGAEDILIPEIKTDVKEISDKLINSRQKESYMIVVAEGDDAGNVFQIAAAFKKLHPEYDIKTLVLGHLLRGGNPTANDRILASRLGLAAVEALIKNKHNVMVGIRNNKIVYTPLHNAKKHFLTINHEWKQLMDTLSC
jgi:6-phosphofructokinase 1